MRAPPQILAQVQMMSVLIYVSWHVRKVKTHKYTFFDHDDEYSYSELSKKFNDMYAESINAFKKTSL